MSIVTDLNLTNLQTFARQNYIPVVVEDTCNFLYQTVQKLQPKNILEIGTAIGYSGIVMLNACKTANLTTIEIDQDKIKMAQQNFESYGVLNRISTILGDAKQKLTMLNSEYDFMFLDGPKGQYVHYLPLMLPHLKVGGIIFCDNLNYKKFETENGFVPHRKRTIYTNLKKFIEEIEKNNNLKTEFFEIGDGVAIITKLK